jgi:hypothetical protein
VAEQMVLFDLAPYTISHSSEKGKRLPSVKEHLSRQKSFTQLELELFPKAVLQTLSSKT